MELAHKISPTSGIHERRHAKMRLIKSMNMVPPKKKGKASPARERMRIFSGEMYVLATERHNNNTVTNENPVMMLAMMV